MELVELVARTHPIISQGKQLRAIRRDIAILWPCSSCRYSSLFPRVGPDRAGIAAATNDIGLVTLPDGRHLAIAVFITDSRANDADRDAAIARLAQAVWECVTSPAP
jgi:hypothetical protein